MREIRSKQKKVTPPSRGDRRKEERRKDQESKR